MRIYTHEDLTRKKFNRLYVLKLLRDKRGLIKWLCKCDCGNITNVRGDFLKNGVTKSCGCLQKEIVTQRGFVHGMYKTRFYCIWENIKSRILNPNNPKYKYYGGRGIRICQGWQKFENFKQDMFFPYSEHVKKYGEKNTTIDRIDNAGNYCKENCRWATQKEQMNNSRCVRFITFNKKTLSISQWAEKLGMPRTTLYNRLWKGWSVEKAFKTCF